jgi:HlyD family secretion protein
MQVAKHLFSSLTILLAMILSAGCAQSNKESDDKKADAADDAAAVMNLPLVHVAIKNVANFVRIPGTVAALPDHSIKVSSAVAGKLVAVLVVPGEKVTKGQVIAKLDSRALQDAYKQTDASLATAKIGVEQAKTNLLLAKNTAERTKRLVDLDIAAQKDLVLADSQVKTASAQVLSAQSTVEQAAAARSSARTQLTFTEVRSPLTGVVALRFLNNGDTVDSATPIAQIVDLETVIVSAFIPVVMPTRILPGFQAIIKSASIPDRSYPGTVTSISPVVDAQTGNILAQIRCTNSNLDLKEGMPVTVSITTVVHKNALVVPETSLVASPEEPNSRMVYVVHGNEIKRVRVKTGIERDGFVEIVNGLSPNAVVVEKGAYGLPDGTKVEAKSDRLHETAAFAGSRH